MVTITWLQRIPWTENSAKNLIWTGKEKQAASFFLAISRRLPAAMMIGSFTCQICTLALWIRCHTTRKWCRIATSPGLCTKLSNSMPAERRRMHIVMQKKDLRFLVLCLSSIKEPSKIFGSADPRYLAWSSPNWIMSLRMQFIPIQDFGQIRKFWWIWEPHRQGNQFFAKIGQKN